MFTFDKPTDYVCQKKYCIELFQCESVMRGEVKQVSWLDSHELWRINTRNVEDSVTQGHS